MRRFLFLICAAGIGGALIFCSGCEEQKKKEVAEREVRVTLRPLEKRIFREQIPVQGTVTPVDHAVISAKISGTLEMLNVSEGDECAEDAVLFGIDRQVLAKEIEYAYGVAPEQNGLNTPKLKGVTAEVQREIDRRTKKYSRDPEEYQVGRAGKVISNISWDQLADRKVDPKRVAGKL